MNYYCMKIKKTSSVVFVLMFWVGFAASAQSHLSKTVSLQADKQRLDAVLEILSNKGGFQFSYKTDIIKRDSIVSIAAVHKTVRQILDLLFAGRLDYVESGEYVILRFKPIQISSENRQSKPSDKWYIITGKVLDYYTGAALANVSIYERDRLVSTLTNTGGFFKLKLKANNRTAALSVSKDDYLDTMVKLTPKFNTQLTIAIIPEPERGIDEIVGIEQNDSVDEIIKVVSDTFRVEETKLGNFLLSTKAKTQNRNIRNFLANRSFQISFVPGLSTWGFLNSKVTNKLSFNVIGGYSGGVDQFELGGVFNIVNKNVQYVQVAGVFNLVGGSVKGLQLAGVSNYVGGNVKGWQVAGVSNHVAGNTNGVQVAGTVNISQGKITGAQLAGTVNISLDTLKGLQLSGSVNVSKGYLHGAQVSGLVNYAKKIKGLQLGIVNIADSVDGLSLGLISIVKKGYHKLGISSNEILPINLEIKTGTHRFYNIFSAGVRPGNSSRIYTAGYGIGNESRLNEELSINTELSSHFLYLGSWNYDNSLTRLSLQLNLALSKRLAIYAGPSLSVYYSDQPTRIGSYAFDIPGKGLGNFTWGTRTRAWFGFNAGIHLF